MIEVHEKERRNLDLEQIQQEKQLQHDQHEEQLKTLKEIHGKLLVLHRQHCIEEEEFQVFLIISCRSFLLEAN